jgi:glutaminase
VDHHWISSAALSLTSPSTPHHEPFESLALCYIANVIKLGWYFQWPTATATAMPTHNALHKDKVESTVIVRDWQATLEEIATDIQPYLSEGEVASYIPALAQVDPNQFGIAFTDLQGNTYKAGPSADTPFSIQSISKVFALVMALDLEGDALWQRVGREPSGSRFNSIVQLESEQGRPRNPLINAGAIAVTNSIQQHYCSRNDSNQQSNLQEYSSMALDKILDFLRSCAQTNDDAIRIDPDVARSEAEFGDRNRALAYFMSSYGIVQGDIGQSLHIYFHQCALEMSVVTLSRAGLFLAAAGRNPLVASNAKETTVTSHEIVARVNSLMMLCGHYDMSGDFAFRVGLPAKSGVGGCVRCCPSSIFCLILKTASVCSLLETLLVVGCWILLGAGCY